MNMLIPCLFIFAFVFVYGAEDRFKWVCTDDTFCQRLSDVNGRVNAIYPTVEVCRLICGVNGPLWPKPQKVHISNKELFLFSDKHIQTTITGPKVEILDEILAIFKQKLGSENCQHTNYNLNIQIIYKSNDITLNWRTDESYNFFINSKVEPNNLTINIEAENVYGVRHALETLSQLIENYPDKSCLAIPKDVTVRDFPVFPHRGLLLDSARTFLSLDIIKRQIDAMASSKLNYLHWHITDSQSFPLESPQVPNMTIFGSFSISAVYKYDDLKKIIHYAKVRGIKIIFEIDSPSHAGFGWQWGDTAGLGNLTVCLNAQPWRSYCVQPPCGQLNPSNQYIYKILHMLYQDIHKLDPDSKVFHMGGDEIFIPCWNSSKEIIDYIGNKSRITKTFLDLWGEFQDKAIKSYDSAVGNTKSDIIVWSSALTDPNIIENYLDKTKYVIQTWVPSYDEMPDQLLKMGYRLIISTKNAWYLDHGFWGNTQYYQWQTVYNNVIPRTPGVLGGEVCMWGEYVDDNAIEGKIWPRAAAAAERLWSNPPTLYNEAKIRFYRHRERLVSLGVKANDAGPRWCYLNEGYC